MRITTGMIASQYGRNLNRSLSQFNAANNRATTQRRFDRASENPVAAAKAYGLRTAYSQNEDYLLNTQDTENLFQTAHSSKLSISNILQEIGSQDILSGVNGTYTPEDRKIVATKIKRLQEAMLANMNAKYGDKYMFNGGEYKKQPFTLDKSGNLLYRGINVDTGLHVGNKPVSDKVSYSDAKIDFGAKNATLLKDYTIEFSTDGVGTNSVDSVGKKIVIGTGGGNMTAADILAQLQSLPVNGSATGLPLGIDVNEFTVTGDITASNLPITGVDIDFNDPAFDGFTIEFSNSAVGTNSINKNSKKIVIGVGNPMQPMTAADLKNQLDTYLGSLPTTDLPDGAIMPPNIDVTGRGTPPSDATAVTKPVKITVGSLATNLPAEAYVGGAIINFGCANGDLLNGYTINLVKGPVAGVGTNNDKKVINITLPDPPPPTKADLEAVLKNATATQLPPGVDPDAITVPGDSAMTINFGTGEITGGEPSIAEGTAFDLDLLAKETRYIDLGLGVNFDSHNKLDSQTVFDVSMPGLSMLGFGFGSDGSPNNIYSLINRIAKDLEDPNFNLEASTPLINKFNGQRDNLLYNITDTDSKTTFIKFTSKRLEDTKLNLSEKMINVELMDPAQAIMEFKMQQYAYMAALQMGTKIIQPTFLDFMS